MANISTNSGMTDRRMGTAGAVESGVSSRKRLRASGQADDRDISVIFAETEAKPSEKLNEALNHQPDCR